MTMVAARWRRGRKLSRLAGFMRASLARHARASGADQVVDEGLGATADASQVRDAEVADQAMALMRQQRFGDVLRRYVLAAKFGPQVDAGGGIAVLHQR